MTSRDILGPRRISWTACAAAAFVVFASASAVSAGGPKKASAAVEQQVVGIWRGEQGRVPVTLVLKWDGSALAGTARLGLTAAPLRLIRPEFDGKKLTFKLESPEKLSNDGVMTLVNPDEGELRFMANSEAVVLMKRQK
jgi:hypothetical protein